MLVVVCICELLNDAMVDPPSFVVIVRSSVASIRPLNSLFNFTLVASLLIWAINVESSIIYTPPSTQTTAVDSSAVYILSSEPLPPPDPPPPDPPVYRVSAYAFVRNSFASAATCVDVYPVLPTN